MDPIVTALAGKVMAVLTPFVARSAQDFISAAGEIGHQRVQKLLARIKERWGSDVGSTVILEKYEEDPAAFEAAVRAILETRLAEDAELRTDVETAMNEMGPVLDIVQRVERADKVTGLESSRLSGGRASVTQEITTGREVIGAKIDRIG